MPEAKSVTSTISNLYIVKRTHFPRALHSAASLAGAPKGFSGLTPGGELIVGSAIKFNSIGAPVEAGGPSSGSWALTIDRDRALQLGMTWTGDHGWSSRITSAIAQAQGSPPAAQSSAVAPANSRGAAA